MATAPTSTAQTRKARIRCHGAASGKSIRPKTSWASAPVMLTSNPLKVLMNAANAPAQVMPLRIDPHGILFERLLAGVAAGEKVGEWAGEPTSPDTPPTFS